MAGTLTVTPAPLTITADNQTKVYGAALPALTVQLQRLCQRRHVGQPHDAADGHDHGHGGQPRRATYAITASGAVDPDYTISYVGGTLTVTPAALTITADNQTKVYGAALPALTASYSGFVNGDTSASLTTQPTLTTTATAASHVAATRTASRPAGRSDADYTISYVAGTLTVTPAPLTITADNQTQGLRGGAAGVDGPATAASSTATRRPASRRSRRSTTTATAASHVRQPYPITASGAADADYTISYVGGTLTRHPGR